MQPWAGGTLERLPKVAWNNLLLKYLFWCWLEHSTSGNSRISCCCESYDHTLKVLSAMQCTCLFMLLTSSYKWNFKLGTHDKIMTRASITCWNWLTTLLAMHGSPQIPIHWTIIQTWGRRSKGIEILGTCSVIASASWHVTLRRFKRDPPLCHFVFRVAEDLVPTCERERLSWPHPAEVEIFEFEISFKQRWPEIMARLSWIFE